MTKIIMMILTEIVMIIMMMIMIMMVMMMTMTISWQVECLISGPSVDGIKRLLPPDSKLLAYHDADDCHDDDRHDDCDHRKPYHEHDGKKLSR